MSSNPMQKKVRNAFFLGTLIMLVIILLVGAIVYFTVIKPKIEEEEEQTIVYVYRLKPGINVESGAEVLASMVECVEIPVTTLGTDFIQAKNEISEGNLIDIPFTEGYKSKIDLEPGTILTYSMLYEGEKTEDSLRYVEYNMLTMPTTLGIGDYIDIRLRLPNTQDLIVTTKKQIVNIYGNTVGLNLTEEEILILNSAIVECYMMDASELYIATYVEPGLQTAAIYTYVPTQKVIDLINIDENIVAQAKAELAAIYNKKDSSGATVGTTTRQNVEESVNQYSQEDRQSNLEQSMQQQIENAKKAREDYLSEMEGY